MPHTDHVPQQCQNGLLKTLLRTAQFNGILADESTDNRTRNELSICFRFVLGGEAVEQFFSLQNVQVQ